MKNVVKNAGLFLVASALIVSAVIVVDRFAPIPERPPICDDLCEAMRYINAGQDIPVFIHFPIYMSRFKLEVVEMVDHQSQLPNNICLGEKVALITDSVTGYQWLTNGYGARYRIYRIL